MFGRKHKQEQEQDNSGLSVTVSPSVTSAPAKPVVTSAPAVGTGSTAFLGQLLSGHGQVGELVAQIRADPQGFREQIMQQAQAAGVSTFVITPQGMKPIGHPANTPAPPHLDVVDELTKAADLHDKGALTDAEFEKLKAQLLGR